MKTEERMRLAGMVAGISALVFAVPHFWFWCGISFAFPGDFEDLSRTNVLLIVGGLAVLAGVYAVVFTHSQWVRRLPEFFTALPAWVGSAGFTLWGLAYFGLQIQLAFSDATSSDRYFASDTNPNAIWGIYWYSLFVVWGLSLGMTAFYFHRLKRGQYRATQELTRLDVGPVRTCEGLSENGQTLKEGLCQ